MSVGRGVIQAGWLAGELGAWRRFRRAARDPEAAQRQKLGAIVRAGAGAAYLRDHGVRDAGDFGRLPVVTYDDLRPWIDRVAGGEPDVLTTLPVRMMERTGGSSGGDKLIPYTDALRAEFAAAVGAWMVDLHRRRPALIGTSAYWSVSPAARARETTEGGLPIGFDDDTEYFSPAVRWAMGRLLAVPGTVARIPDLEAWRATTWRHLLEAEDLGLISVWSPTFLSRLFAWLAEHPEVIDRLPEPRRRQVRERVAAEGLTARALWPRLQIVSCWTEGFAAALLPELRRWIGGVEVQGKGLLATEGVVSIPWAGGHGGSPHGCALAATSHVVELEDLDAGRVIPMTQARVSGRYAPILTTSGGLWRYKLGDAVTVVGRWRNLPLVRFDGRIDRVADLVGEKVSEGQVAAALQAARAAGFSWRFAMLAPTPARRYRLYVDGDVEERALAGLIEGRLRESMHYAYARDLGQLDPLDVVRVADGWAGWERGLKVHGQRLGDAKPAPLDVRTTWDAAFGVSA